MVAENQRKYNGIPDPCPDGLCGGTGLVDVDERYVERMAGAGQERAAAVRNSVHPCPRCRPEQWRRWQGLPDQDPEPERTDPDTYHHHQDELL